MRPVPSDRPRRTRRGVPARSRHRRRRQDHRVDHAQQHGALDVEVHHIALGEHVDPRLHLLGGVHLLVDQEGSLYTANNNGRINIYLDPLLIEDSEAQCQAYIDNVTTSLSLQAFAVDQYNNLYVADYQNDQINIYKTV